MATQPPAAIAAKTRTAPSSPCDAATPPTIGESSSVRMHDSPRVTYAQNPPVGSPAGAWTATTVSAAATVRREGGVIAGSALGKTEKSNE